MTCRRHGPAAVTGVILLGLVAAACSSNRDTEPATRAAPAARAAPAEATGERTAVGIEPGVAGGVFEDTSTVAVTVRAVDVGSRRVTLADDAGNEATLTARPEIRNLDQLRAGDRLTATIKKRLVITAGAGGGEPRITYNTAVASPGNGTTPGGAIAETCESVAAVTAIDGVHRTATLKFADGLAHTVPVRSDVDLSRYKVGDSVIVRTTSTLSVLASR